LLRQSFRHDPARAERLSRFKGQLFLAISPPSDIVLDVARAVEPAGVEAAKAELARRAGGLRPSSPSMAFSLSETASAAMPGAARGAEPPSAESANKRFEAMVLQTFIQEMMPKNAESVYGKGVAGDMWKSMMAGKLADVMADRGGIGIADRLLADRYKDGDRVAPVGPVSRGPEQTESDRQAMLSTALVQELQRKMTDAMTGDPQGDEPRVPNL